MTENFDKYFKERLEDYVESPLPGTWDGIAARIGHARKNRAIVIFLRIAAGIALLFSLSVIMLDTKMPATDDFAAVATVPEDTTKELIAKNRMGTQSHIAIGTPDKELPAAVNTELHLAQSYAEIIPKAENNHHLTEKSPYETDYGYTSARAQKEISVIAVPTREENPDRLVALSSFIPNAARPGIGRPVSIEKKEGDMPQQVYTIDQMLALNEPLPEVKNRKNTWAVGGQFAPQYSYRNIVSEEYSDYVISQINSKESSLITYSGGVNVILSSNRRLSVQSGVYYSRYGQEQTGLLQLNLNKNVLIDQVSPDGLEYAFGSQPQQLVYINNSSGPVSLVSKASASMNQSPDNRNYTRNETSSVNAIATEKPISSISHYYEYLEVPVNIRYKVIDRKIGISVLGGISTNFLVGTGFNLNYTDETAENITRSASDLVQINYAGSVGMGFEYPLIKNIILTIEPKFKYYLNPIDKDPLSDIHPYAIGLFTGV
ncbi:MAG: hypothetical protein R6W78_19010, partial [Bacteroidales bacterium]